MRAIEKIREEYISEEELAKFLGVDTKRVRDLRSNHVTGKRLFIDHIKPSSKCILYYFADVMMWLNTTDICSFGKNEKCGEENEVSDLDE